MSRREMQRTTRRGFFAVGIESGKTPANVGTLWRTAHLYGAAFICTVGARYPSKYQPTDTMKTAKHTPLFEYEDVIDLAEHLPRDCRLVGIELHEDARPLPRYTHPERALYLLGAEDFGLSEEAVKRCDDLLVLPCPLPYSMNVAVAGSIVIYDRYARPAPTGKVT